MTNPLLSVLWGAGCAEMDDTVGGRRNVPVRLSIDERADTGRDCAHQQRFQEPDQFRRDPQAWRGCRLPREAYHAVGRVSVATRLSHVPDWRHWLYGVNGAVVLISLWSDRERAGFLRGKRKVVC